MSEEYTRLFEVKGDLYITGVPLVLRAGALTKSNASGKVFIQAKFVNISPKNLKALKVVFTLYDIEGKPTGSEAEYQYLDLDVERGKEFGGKTPIYLSDNSARSFFVRSVYMIYDDGSVIENTAGVWKSIPTLIPLEDTVEDGELLEQYRLEYGKEYKYEIAEFEDLKICGCGAICGKDDESCYCCGGAFIPFSAVDMDALKKNCDERREAKTKKEIRYAIIVVAAVLLVAIISSTSSNLSKLAKYNDALALVDANKFDSAVRIFDELGNFRDSAEQIEITKETEEKYYDYLSAEEYLADGYAEDALNAFVKLADFRDSPARADEAREIIYNDAVSTSKYSREGYKSKVRYKLGTQTELSMETDSKLQAVVIFKLIPEYKDSKEKITAAYDEAADRYMFWKRGHIGEPEEFLEAVNALKNNIPFYVNKDANIEAAKDYWLSYANSLAEKSEYAKAFEHFEMFSKIDSAEGAKSIENLKASLKSKGDEHLSKDEYGKAVEAYKIISDSVDVEKEMEQAVESGAKALAKRGLLGENGTPARLFNTMVTSIYYTETKISYDTYRTEGAYFTAALKQQGNLCYTKLSNAASGLGLVSLAADGYSLIGLNVDGKIEICTSVPSRDARDYEKSRDKTRSIVDFVNSDYNKNIVSIVGSGSSSNNYLVLTAEGRAIIPDVTKGGGVNPIWSDIANIDMSASHAVGLKTDGTVVTRINDGYTRYYDHEALNVGDWTDIVDVEAGFLTTFGLRADGTVVAVGNEDYGVLEANTWTDIVDISASTYIVVGLKSDGTVVAAGPQPSDLFDESIYKELDKISEWSDITGISAGADFVVGLKSDGTLVALGENDHGQCDVNKAGWNDFLSFR